MKIMIAVASRHGGTQGIATRLSSELHRLGHDVDVLAIDGGPCPDGYDAYIVGSAVYGGRWTKEGRRFVHDHVALLRSRPLFLFSSGPLGDHAGAAAIDHPEEIGTLAGAREHRVFPGRLFRKDLGPAERIAAAAVHAPEGDFRDWADVAAWADHLDADLRDLATSST